MPELPEVETVRKGLEKKTQNFLIDKIEVLKERSIASYGGSEEFKPMMLGLKIGGWKRRGKYLIAELLKESNTKGGWLVVHLRMTGQFQFHINRSDSCPHTRVRFWNPAGIELRFVDTRNFGQMWWIPPDVLPAERIKGLSNLGPEPFSKNFNLTYLRECLKGRKRSIKATLLDQSIVAGIGNIYADESLFEAGISPEKESRQIKNYELEKLIISIKKILKISIGEGGTTFSDFRDLNGVNGNYGGQALVYRRSNKPCKKCGHIIQRTKIAGRSSHWCPNCQK